MDSEVHAAHAAGRIACRRSGLLGLVSDNGFGRQEQSRDGRCVLQCRAGDLDRVVDACSEQVAVLVGRSVEAVTCGQVGDLVRNNAGLEACVECDLLERSGQCNANDVRAGCLVTFELEVVQCGSCLEKCNATTGDDALFDGCLCVTHCIFDAVLALLELDLGSSAGLDDCNAAGQLGQTFLQLLTVVIRVAVLDLGADLADTTGDCVGVAGTLDDGGLVLGDVDLACLAEELGHRSREP